MQHSRNKQSETLIDKIADHCKQLIYISEVDAPVEPFTGDDPRTFEKGPGSEGPERDAVTTVSTDINDFFGRLTKQEAWHTKERKRQAENYRRLRSLLEKELTDLVVIRIGKINVEIYVVGKGSEGDVIGIRTVAVET